MLLSPTPDQEFFRETTDRFLGDRLPVAEVRRLRDDPLGYVPRIWAEGAELGWTSLLVAEEHGGGSISGSGLVDLTLVAYEFGRRATPGPLVPTNVVAAALSRAGGPHVDVLGDLLSGTSVATWCYGEPPPGDRLGQVALEIAPDGDSFVLNGAKRPVEAALGADHLLVTGRTGAGLTQVLVPARTPGVSVEPMRSLDVTRRFASVTFDDVRVPSSALVGEVGGAAGDVERQLLEAIVLLCAETVGAMQTTFDITVEWAFDRYSFGRPLASYQALKHRFADMRSWLEGGHAVSDAAAAAVAVDISPESVELASAAKAFVGHYGTELAQDCVQLHGGIGVTYEHDLHLYLRRITVDAALYGTPAEHRRRIAEVVRARETAA
ncbi:MAG TPA: acyl-CoA dehydrogenase family protein [Acidimicrobiales bacterium]|nr:acyl-CoA dehydrogenase family protein [Acidimicrobiales bacterium]